MYKTILKIDGMMCGMCEAHINDAVRGAAKVKKVSSSHSAGETVVISEEPLDEKMISEVIEKTGYHLLSSVTEPYEKKGFSLFRKK